MRLVNLAKYRANFLFLYSLKLKFYVFLFSFVLSMGKCGNFLTSSRAFKRNWAKLLRHGRSLILFFIYRTTMLGKKKYHLSCIINLFYVLLRLLFQRKEEKWPRVIINSLYLYCFRASMVPISYSHPFRKFSPFFSRIFSPRRVALECNTFCILAKEIRRCIYTLLFIRVIPTDTII